MARVLVTGMSGTGKSTVLAALRERGHETVSADDDGRSYDVPTPDGLGLEQLWDEDRMDALLAASRAGHLFVSGCAGNQGRFYSGTSPRWSRCFGRRRPRPWTPDRRSARSPMPSRGSPTLHAVFPDTAHEGHSSAAAGSQVLWSGVAWSGVGTQDERDVTPASPCVAGPTRRVPIWLHRVGELVLAVVLYRVYAAIRNAEGASQSGTAFAVSARHRGLDVLQVERSLHLDIEHVVQSTVLAAPEWVIRSANVYYATVHLPLTLLVFVWLLTTRPHRQFVAWRNTLVVATAVALVCFALLPTMPPRLLPGSDGYVDTVARFGGLWSGQTPVLEHIACPFAAMPSLHIVWALWSGTAIWRLARWAWLRRLGAAHIAITAVVVLATGNHWLLDVVAGAALYAVAAALAWAPARWAETRAAVVPAAAAGS